MLKTILGISRFFLICLLVGCVLAPRQPMARLPAPRPNVWDDIKHVVIITLENGSPIEASKQPFLRDLMRRGASMANYYGVTHPSQPNYIAMVSGNTYNVHGDWNADLLGKTIADLLEAQGKTWKVYAEDYPSPCFLGESHGIYVRKHVPFLSFVNVQTDPSRCSKIVPATEFSLDQAQNQLPHYSFYVPNLENDGHNTGLAYTSRWLKNTFEPYFANEQLMKETLFIVTFDEDDWFHGNRIYTVFLGAGVKPGYTSNVRYDHYNMLKTVEEIFKLGNLAQHDLFAEPIWDIWQ
jgi:phospholipase C